MNFFKPKVIYRVLEVDRPTKLPELTPELKDSLRTLTFHPGFQYILNRFRLERANLKKYLEEGSKLTESEMRWLQAGIFFSGWLDSEIGRLTITPAGPAALDIPDDSELFSKLQEQLELIG